MSNKESVLNKSNCTLEEILVAQNCAPKKQGFKILQGIEFLYRGYSKEEVCNLLRCSLRTVQRWIRNFNEQGLDGVVLKGRSGRPRRISLDKFKAEYIPALETPEKYNQTCWNAIKFHGFLTAECNEVLSYSSVLNYLHESNYSYIKGRPSVVKRDEEKRQEFLQEVKSLSEDPEVEFWFQDESGFEGDPRPRRRWYKKGCKYSHNQQSEHLRYSVVGAISPASGESFMLAFDGVDSDAFQFYIDRFNENIVDKNEGKKHVMIVDNARWHTSNKINWGNVTPLFLPTYSPDLNPIENLWKFIKNNYFNGWYAKNIEELIERICLALSDIIEKTEQVKKTANMDYLLG